MQAHVIKLLIRDYQKCHLRIPTPLNKNVKGSICFLLVMYTTDHWSCTFKHKRKRETEAPVLICHICGDKEWVLMVSEAKCNEATAITGHGDGFKIRVFHSIPLLASSFRK